MDVFREPEQLRHACDQARGSGKRVGLVPTMGALHDGHMGLVTEARSRSDFVVVSIFVNPTQFGPGEDLDAYPRPFEADRARCEQASAAAIFVPTNTAMYPPGEETRVRVGETAAALCGASRPGHFEGVCTVVTKLFSLVGPCVAVFGRKDYQQLQVIKRFTRDLLIPVEVIGARTVREPDGLALSSRNAYLSEADRGRAIAIPQALTAAVRAFERGERQVARLEQTVRAVLEPAVDEIVYIAVATPDDVVPLEPTAQAGAQVLLAVAARVGGTRLIDNVVLGEDPAPMASSEG
ncbi:MAG: pantoate--beta-alanine ligase [Deltaproteobacteria bacterium]|nr:pantoate--beta-alanine ligase [Deltaproteobacteria bacterium]